MVQCGSRSGPHTTVRVDRPREKEEEEDTVDILRRFTLSATDWLCQVMSRDLTRTRPGEAGTALPLGVNEHPPYIA